MQDTLDTSVNKNEEKEKYIILLHCLICHENWHEKTFVMVKSQKSSEKDRYGLFFMKRHILYYNIYTKHCV